MSARVARHPAPARALLWHGPPHAVMLGVMVLAMLPGAGPTGHLAGCAALGALAIGLAPFTRHAPELQPVLLDVGAMAIVLAGFALSGPAIPAPGAGGAGHAHGIDGLLLAAGATIAWAVVRIRCTRGAVSVATGAVSAVGLAGMAVLALA